MPKSLGGLGLTLSEVVHEQMKLAAAGVTVMDDGDTLGMRASQSCSIRLERVRAERDRVIRRLDPGPNPDLLAFSIFANFEILLSAVYTGIAGRALELAVENASTRTSANNGGATKSLDPDVRWKIADAAIAYDGVLPQLESLARSDRWLNQTSHCLTDSSPGAALGAALPGDELFLFQTAPV